MTPTGPHHSPGRAGLPRKTDAAIAALLQHGTVERAAESIQISAPTLWRWLKQPEFRESYRSARREATSRAVARLQHAAGSAVNTLLRVMTDHNASASSRVRAAQCVLDQSFRSMELEDLEARLERLEQSGNER